MEGNRLHPIRGEAITRSPGHTYFGGGVHPDGSNFVYVPSGGRSTTASAVNELSGAGNRTGSRRRGMGGTMSQQLATALRGEPAEDNLVVGPVVPIFVDTTGRRRRWVIALGWLVALACVAYLGVIGVSMTGTTVGPLPSLPSVPSHSVVFGSEVEGLPDGALEAAPLPVPAVAPPPQVAAEPVSAPAPRTAAKPSSAPRATTKPFSAPATRATAKPSSASPTTAKSSPASGSSSPVRMRGTSR